jgi:hypothetical protein
MKKKTKSTYEKFIEDSDQKSLLDKEYKELLLTELQIAEKKIEDQHKK